MNVPSPCVRNCCLDDNDICLGCGRTVEEIIRWGDAVDNEKLEVLKSSKKRIAERIAAKKSKQENIIILY